MNSVQSDRKISGEGAFVIKAPFVVCRHDCVLESAYVHVLDGKIAKVSTSEPEADCGPITECPDNSVLIPGLVNAHTHIELQRFKGAGRGLPFADWIAEMTRQVLATSPAEIPESADQGALVQISGGVTAIADHSTFGFSGSAMKKLGLKGRVYREVFSPDPDFDPTENIIAIRNWIESQIPSNRISYGISAHSPYNAPPAALLAIEKAMPGILRSIHVAESREESEYIQNGSGPFAERYRQRGFRIESKGVSSVQYLLQQGFVQPHTLCIHLTQASEEDLKLLMNAGAVGVFCPISNATLGCGLPPIASAQITGMLCCIGTDSAVSDERQDLFEEARVAILASRQSDNPISEADAFSMITSNGANALQINCGTIEPEKAADLCLIQLTDNPDSSDPVADIIWNAGRECVRKVWIDGVLRYQA